jgi:hypothetical protein
MYNQLATHYKHWKVVECVEDGKLLSKEAIFETVLGIVKPMAK